MYIRTCKCVKDWVEQLAENVLQSKTMVSNVFRSKTMVADAMSDLIATLAIYYMYNYTGWVDIGVSR